MPEVVAAPVRGRRFVASFAGGGVAWEVSACRFFFRSSNYAPCLLYLLLCLFRNLTPPACL
jgi:hypothetical protein